MIEKNFTNNSISNWFLDSNLRDFEYLNKTIKCSNGYYPLQMFYIYYTYKRIHPYHGEKIMKLLGIVNEEKPIVSPICYNRYNTFTRSTISNFHEKFINNISPRISSIRIKPFIFSLGLIYIPSIDKYKYYGTLVVDEEDYDYVKCQIIANLPIDTRVFKFIRRSFTSGSNSQEKYENRVLKNISKMLVNYGIPTIVSDEMIEEFSKPVEIIYTSIKNFNTFSLELKKKSVDLWCDLTKESDYSNLNNNFHFESHYQGEGNKIFKPNQCLENDIEFGKFSKIEYRTSYVLAPKRV